MNKEALQPDSTYPLVVNDLTRIFYPTKSLFSLFKTSEPFKAVNHISFKLHAGEILGLLGPNGAGKTTTIQMLLGNLIPTQGTIYYSGKNLQTHRSTIAQKVTHVSAYTKLPGSLTVQESLDIYARLYGVSKNDRHIRMKNLLESFGIDHLRHRFTNTLSAGQTTRVMLVKAFIPYPKVVLLDEPTASLDPDIANETRRFILEQQQEFGVSMILTSHNMQEVAQICNRILVLQQGSIIEEDTPDKLAKRAASTLLILNHATNLQAAMHYLQSHQLLYKIEENLLLISIEEQQIPHLLHDFATLNIHYVHIEIQKPDLEDYFLSLTRSSSQNFKRSL